MWQIARETGWTVNYILNKVNYQTLIMMLSDAPRYVETKDSKPDEGLTEEDEANQVAGFFTSNLTR